jgi:GT2 family glycosyltransferase
MDPDPDVLEEIGMSTAPAARIGVLVTCYNRVETTLANLGALIAALDRSGAEYTVHLLDDASPDETGARVSAAYPRVNVVRSEGNLFWNRGMHRIYQEARRHGPYDGYLLFNDDVTVNEDNVVKFVECWIQLNRERPTTLIGATSGSSGTQTTYSAYRLRHRHRLLAVSLLEPGDELQEADTFNANFVLVPGPVLDALGGPDPRFLHYYGDIDLGYSIRRMGVRQLLFPGWVGRCDMGKPLGHADGGLFRRLRLGLTGHANPRQNAYLIWKHAENRAVAAVVITAMLIKRLASLVLNKPSSSARSERGGP